jgi:preprotein translocase subunit SecF
VIVRFILRGDTKIMNNLLLTLLSLLAITSPATADDRNLGLPLILGIIAGLLIIAMVIVNVMGKKK